MLSLAELIGIDGCLGVVRSTEGELVRFRRRGVADLLELCARRPDFIRGAEAADKVVGRGAALLFVHGRLARLHAIVASAGAMEVLRQGGVEATCEREVPHIINRAGTDICPVERLTASITDPAEAFEAIKRFVAEAQSGDNHQPT